MSVMKVDVFNANPGTAAHVATASTASPLDNTRRHNEYQAAMPKTARTATDNAGTHGWAPRSFRKGQSQKIWPTSVRTLQPSSRTCPVS
jgi:hypothetical protein